MEVEQASLMDGVTLDAVSFGQDGGGATAVDVGGSEVAQALVAAPVVVVLDEGGELGLELAGQVVVLEQDPVLQRLVPALDFSLGLRVTGRATDVLDPLIREPVCEIARNVARAIVREQPRPVVWSSRSSAGETRYRRRVSRPCSYAAQD